MPPAVLLPIAIGAAGLGVGLLGSSMMKNQAKNGMDAQMAQSQQALANRQEVMEATPLAPVNPNQSIENPDVAANEEANAAAVDVAKRATAAKMATDPTGGLGITEDEDGVSTLKPTLGGY